MARTIMSVMGLVMAVASFATTVMAAGEEDIFELQPEIHHIFRQEEKMPPAAFSTLFTLIALAPWLILVGGWLQLGYTPGKVISELVSGSTLRTAYITAFLGSLVSLEYLFYLYWTRLNLLQTLTWATALSIITFITGQRALSSIQSTRIANQKK